MTNGDDAVRDQQSNYPDDPYPGKTHEHKFSALIETTAEHIESHVAHHWGVEEQWALRMGLESVANEARQRSRDALRVAITIAEDLCCVVCDCRHSGEPIAPGDAHSTFCRAWRARRDLIACWREVK